MFEWEADGKHLFIRDLSTEEDFHSVEEIQKEAWGFSDLDVVPAAHLIASKCAGGLVLGAFDGNRMVGFVYGFPSIERGNLTIHSHMLAVRPDSRKVRAGLYLKLAQREWALDHGIDEVTWTFDPLQSLNANLNFGRLGVTARRYIVNFYGEATSSPLHQGFGTDRLWVNWMLNSDHVKARLEYHSRSNDRYAKPFRPPVSVEDFERLALIQTDSFGNVISDKQPALAANRCFIEIPDDINRVKERHPELGRTWRIATRSAFLRALESGFVVQDFQRITTPGATRWTYVLERRDA